MKTRYGKTAVQQNKYYEVDNIYLYMIENYMNGNISQLRVLYKELCSDAKKDFISVCFNEANPQYLQEIILATI